MDVKINYLDQRMKKQQQISIIHGSNTIKVMIQVAVMYGSNF